MFYSIICQARQRIVSKVFGIYRNSVLDTSMASSSYFHILMMAKKHNDVTINVELCNIITIGGV